MNGWIRWVDRVVKVSGGQWAVGDRSSTDLRG